LQQLTDDQWRDAFRAGGYEPRVAARFIAQLHARIEEARRISGVQTMVASPSR